MRRLAVVCFTTAIAMVAAAVFVTACGSSPGNTSAPTVSKNAPQRFGGPPPGAPVVGDIMFAGSGQWSGSPTGFTYQWDDCNSGGGSCTTAAGSPTNTQRYAIVSGDLGFTIRVQVTASYSGHPNSSVMSQPTGVVTGAEFPLQVSGNGRYLEQNDGAPFLLVGDSPQSVMAAMSVSNAATYLADRESHGFNAVWTHLLCDNYITSCFTDGKAYNNATSTADNLAPFTSGTGPSNYTFGSGMCGNCNSAYFSQMQTEVAQAQADNIEIFLDPIPTEDCGSGTYSDALVTNGDGTVSTTDADYRYGEYLGTEFNQSSYPNITWISGNDFDCLVYTDGTSTAIQNDALSVANGIAATDPSALQTMEGNYNNENGGGCSFDTCFGGTSLTNAGCASCTGGNATTTWGSRVNLDLAYTYSPMYSAVRAAYAEQSTMPTFLGESNYEGQQDDATRTDGCITIRFCRLAEWWTMTSGATGQLYGGPCYGITNTTNVASTCDTAGVTQLEAQTTFLATIDWWTLAPDANGAGHLITAGGGTCSASATGSSAAATCVTASINSAGTLALIYMPNPSSFSSITVDMTKFANSSVTATWVDPANGAETSVSGSPFTNTGTHTFAQSSNNSAGDKDWALLLTD